MSSVTLVDDLPTCCNLRMDATDPFVEALKRLCRQEGGHQAVADRAHVSAANLWQILAGTKLPSGKSRGVGPNLREKLNAAFPAWVQGGLIVDESHRIGADASNAASPGPLPLLLRDGDMVAYTATPKSQMRAEGAALKIPQYEAGGAMGNGLILEDKQPGLIKSWHVDHEWLRLNVPIHTGVNNLCIVTGFGPSMRPKYNPGDPLLLDRGVVVVETEGIYFFRVGKHGFIKQLQRIPTEAGMVIRAKSLNKDYDPFDITEKMDFEVFGKVLTVWRSEQV